MTILISVLIAFAQGILLGCAFFYVLWLSTQKITGAKPEVLWFIGAWITRMTLAIGGFYLIGMGNWLLLLASLCGFIVGRYLISRFIGANVKSREARIGRATESSTGANHAPESR
nr:ATP synthase subunit I [uncultured Glaciecola sp.]